MYVLSHDAVRWSIETLASQRIHPAFVMYLYLRKQARAGSLTHASASSSDLLSLIDLPGNPAKPYYFPMIDRGKRGNGLLPSLWRASNIAGSWSSASLHRLGGGSWLGGSDGTYSFPDDHVSLALAELLYNQRVSAVALGTFFLRNDGFVLLGAPEPDDIVSGFCEKFDYPDQNADEFAALFTIEPPSDVDFPFFERASLSEDSTTSEAGLDV